MVHDFLYHLQSAKRYVHSPLLATTALGTETDSDLPIDFWEWNLNTSQQHIQNLIIQAFEEYLTKTATITFTAGTNEYTLPTDLIKVKLMERTDVTTDRMMYPIDINKKFQFTSDMADYTREYYAFWGNNVYILPDPASSTATAQIWYIKKMVDLSYGTGTSSDDNLLTLAATPDFGETSAADDYYNGAKVYIVSATTGAGQTATVTDYVGATRVCTLDLLTQPTGTIVYSFLSEIPSEHDMILPVRAAIVAKIKDNEDPAGLASLYEEYRSGLVVGLENRQVQDAGRMECDIDTDYYGRKIGYTVYPVSLDYGH